MERVGEAMTNAGARPRHGDVATPTLNAQRVTRYAIVGAGN